MATTANRTKKRAWPAIILVVLTLLLVVFVIRQLERAPRTDDAYVYADTIDVVPEVNGRIVELPVHDNQAVKQGDLLFRIDPRPYQDALTRGKASLVALDRQIELTQRTVNAQQYNAESVRAAVERARAAAAQASDTLHRMEPLLSHGYVSAEDVDRARTAQRATQAELSAAQLQAQQAAAAVSGVDALVAQRAVVTAEISLAELNLEYATVRAPFDGRIVSLKTATGQFATALKPVFTLIDTRHWYVVANFRETELKGIKTGTPATVYLMSDTDQRFRGSVDSISYGIASDEAGLALPGGLPRIQRTLNWVHVSQRFPVKIRVDDPNPELFRVGTSAVAVLHPGNDGESH
ncbi:efflux pump membrane protein (multidrug resistance protein A) [Burkholderia sp. YR290]|jgi:multidrug efflux system membrane fusion protein|uniref:multidrug transporter subunit MdtN n=1 Tax=Paraburkholderia hospita TaxID=169430 RepID=UPI00027158EE|nr:multidrug transporter subunit MdtN [Paraburkholderia hospita]EUC11697.1 secretion protein HlyD family protein [Burkholderia sp. BT03]SKC99138.1 efflux pump membrane protein (multidrug resistance protein A) [Paraburkholderia hospita]SKD07544.1 efflux pump membrane protein (multidrug resistance protein A) [Paraburkholderia hospita]SOE89525.1 efflux pump membrane protein (multidrug resistance protein A) [Burkholderia sp. YR290]